MAAAAHVFPNFTQGMGTNTYKPSTDTFAVGLATGTFNWVAATEAYTTVSNFLTNSGSGGGGALTEVSTSGTGYSRSALASVTFTNSGLVSTLTCSNISWSATSSWSANYAFFYDSQTNTNDTTRILLAYWDFGGSVSVTNGGTFTLSINASGLVTWTSS